MSFSAGRQIGRAKSSSMQESSSRGTLRTPAAIKVNDDSEKLVKYINDNVVGRNSTFLGPYGKRKGNENIFISFLFYIQIPVHCNNNIIVFEG